MKHHLPAFFIAVSQMKPINSNFKIIPPFNKTIQLYGDRSGGQGNFEFAGLAEIQEKKVVLLKGNDESLKNPSDWRRLVRLILLAQRIKKPVLLWNLPLTHMANNQHPIPLVLGAAIQNAKIQLIKLQQPIVKVFDENIEWNDAMQELELGDGVIIVKPEKTNSIPSEKLERKKLKIVSKQTEITNEIINLLQELTTGPIVELVNNRLQTL